MSRQHIYSGLKTFSPFSLFPFHVVDNVRLHIKIWLEEFLRIEIGLSWTDSVSQRRKAGIIQHDLTESLRRFNVQFGISEHCRKQASIRTR